MVYCLFESGSWCCRRSFPSAARVPMPAVRAPSVGARLAKCRRPRRRGLITDNDLVLGPLVHPSSNGSRRFSGHYHVRKNNDTSKKKELSRLDQRMMGDQKRRIEMVVRINM